MADHMDIDEPRGIKRKDPPSFADEDAPRRIRASLLHQQLNI
jgi:hypothetical protein